MINETVLKADKKTPDYITYLDDNQQKISQKAYHDDGSFTFYVFNKKGEITNTTDYNKDGRQTLFSRLFDN